MVLIAALVLVWPLLRLHRRTGIWGFVRQRRSPGERVVYFGLLVVSALLVTWTAIYSALGSSAAGVWDAPTWAFGAGWLAILCALALLIIAQAQMGASWRIGIDPSPTALVTRGLYRLVRNPIYSAMLLLLLGLLFIAPCLVTLTISFTGMMLIALQARLEERHLLAQHGSVYRTYASRVGRFVPGIGTLAAG
jgi:protein-S-isoprenylcysteine O-methyltransferase Ste14